MSLSKDVFERRKSTGGGLFSFLDGGFAQLFWQIVSLIVKTLKNTNLVASRRFKMKKPSLPFDVRRSKTVLLKLPSDLMVRKAQNRNNNSNNNNNNKHSVCRATCLKILQTVWRWQEANRRRQEQMKHICLWHYVNPQNFTIHSKWLITFKKTYLDQC